MSGLQERTEPSTNQWRDRLRAPSPAPFRFSPSSSVSNQAGFPSPFGPSSEVALSEAPPLPRRERGGVDAGALRHESLPLQVRRPEAEKRLPSRQEEQPAPHPQGLP